jgi:hypothetical protein
MMPKICEDKTLLASWDSSEYALCHCGDCGEPGEGDHGDPCPQPGCDGELYDNDLDFEHECMRDEITEWIKEHNPDGDWRATVTGFGWRNLDGEKEFHAEDGQHLLWAVLPNTECTFNIYDEGDHLSMENAHHDSPTGGEWYHIYPRKEG